MLLLAALACELPSEIPATRPSPTGPPAFVPAAATATPPPFAGTAAPVTMEQEAAGARFAPYTPPADLESEPTPAGPLSLTEIGNPDVVERLDKAQRDLLAQQGFVVVATPFSTFGDLYQDAARQDFPVFITGDALLYSLDVLLDVAWQRAEREHLAPALEVLSQAMVEASLAQWEGAADEAVATAAWQNMAFFAVGSDLLLPGYVPPPAVATLVQDELTLIEQGGVFVSPLFGRQQDYAAFKPPGYYAADATLGRYYQAMAWYAQPLSLDGADAAVARATARRALLMAAAATAATSSGRWQQISQAATFVRGAGGAWSVAEVVAAAHAVYGTLPPTEDLADLARLDDFIATLRSLPRPTAFDPQAAPVFRFMPAAAPPDVAVFHELTFNQVGRYLREGEALPFTAVETAIGPVRGLPRVLDVAAAFGSEEALARLEAEGDTAYDGYSFQMDALRAHFGDLDEADWTQTLGGGWLYATRPLLATHTPGAAPKAWWGKQFNTWVGAWVLQRHGTMLGARPVQAETEAPAATFGYVEPMPLLYGRLAALARQAISGLQARELLDEEVGQKLLRLERLLLALQDIGAKEVSGEALTDDERALVGQVGERLEALLLFAPAAEGAVARIDREPAPVVDVYASASSGEVVQAALGEVWPIYVIVPGDAQPLLAVGGVFSTYELRLMAGERLDDEAWQSLSGQRPAPAAWLAQLLVP